MKLVSIMLAFLMAPSSVFHADDHKYYVSITNIEYVENQKSVQIIAQFFIDDFETLLRERYDENLTLNVKNEPTIVDSYIQRYLADKLKITINESRMYFKFIGKKYEDDLLYCYLEIDNVPKLKSIKVKNDVLFDQFEEQQNIVRLKIYGKKKSFLLLPQNDSCLLKFD